MKTKMIRAGTVTLAIVIAVVSVTWAGPTPSDAQVVAPPRAAVQAVQGEANVAVDRDREPTKLAVGSMVDAWNTVSTNENGKLFLKWETGILNSIGGSSSIFLATRETERGPADIIEMTQGILRVTKQSGGGALTPYMVVTPAASIEPANYDEPVDFIVEVHVPATSAITVVSGSVRIKNLTLSQPTETVLSSCQTVYVDEGKPKLEPLASSSEDLRRLVDETTIPGTIVANLDICPVTSSPETRAAEPRGSAGPRYAESSPYSDYEFEDWESQDVYPYDEISVLPPEPGVGSVVILPGVGRWIIPIDVFTGWRFDPAIIAIYCRHIILDNIMYRDQYYLADLRLQQRQFRNLEYLAQLSGNRSMLWDAQRQLANVNIQEHWANMRLSRLEKKAAGLEQEQHKFAHKLPPGKNLFQDVSNSFNSPKNLKVVQNFRDKMKTDLNVQNQLAGMAGKELTDLRSRVAHERDPQKRMALRDELTNINKDVAQGKLPISAKQPQVKQVVERLAKEQDPKKVQNLQKQLGQLTKAEAPRTADILTKDKLASLKQDLAKFPNPQKRNDLEAQVAQLGQSIEERKRAELTSEKIDSITAQAAKQGDVRKRDELLGQLKELGKTPAAGPAGRLDLLGQRQNLESQLSIEQDKQKRAVLEKALEDQRGKQAELLRQQPERRKQPETLSGQKEDLQKQTERQRLEQDRLKQTEQKREQILQQQQQAEQKHLQQQEQQKQLEQRQQGQADQLRHQKEQAEQTHRQQQQAEQLHKQEQQKQLEQRQQGEQLRHQKEQAEQTHRQQQQTEQLHKQQQHREQPQQQQQQMRQQQQPQQQQQMRQQQQHQQQQAPHVQQPQMPQQHQQQQQQAPHQQQQKQAAPGQQQH